MTDKLKNKDFTKAKAGDNLKSEIERPAIKNGPHRAVLIKNTAINDIFLPA